ncbi:MAG: putative ribosome biogenesis GTPase RsgA [Chitinophagales bacterium]|nr:MAG: putative ribosome biogenesis GTPase RsgA [Chitinophagales bacterium]
MKGRVIKSTGSWYLVRLEDGTLLNCRIKGKFRLEDEKLTNPVAVGDEVWTEREPSDGTAMITELLPRRNYISRQSPRHKQARHIIAANIDQAFLIATIAYPRTSTGFIDRFLLTTEAYHIPAHILFNKLDLIEGNTLRKLEAIEHIYRSIGYPVHRLSALNQQHLEKLVDLMTGKTTLLAGHSGVGKSTFINAVIPGVQQKTAEVSRVHHKGTHATTFAEMFQLPGGGFVIDTPGVKEFGLLDIEPSEVSHYFKEMREVLDKCRFNNCLHVNEPHCAVKALVEEGKIHEERYRNYLKILEDCKATRQEQYD